MALVNAVRGGAHFILHALGMMGGYIGLSFEKWLLDEELCAYARALTRPLDFKPESLTEEVEGIIRVGSGGSYLTRPETLKLCRDAFLAPHLFNKTDDAGRRKAGGPDLTALAQAELRNRRETYAAPDMAPGLVRDINSFIKSRRRGL